MTRLTREALAIIHLFAQLSMGISSRAMKATSSVCFQKSTMTPASIAIATGSRDGGIFDFILFSPTRNERSASRKSMRDTCRGLPCKTELPRRHARLIADCRAKLVCLKESPPPQRILMDIDDQCLCDKLITWSAGWKTLPPQLDLLGFIRGSCLGLDMVDDKAADSQHEDKAADSQDWSPDASSAKRRWDRGGRAPCGGRGPCGSGHR